MHITPAILLLALAATSCKVHVTRTISPSQASAFDQRMAPQNSPEQLAIRSMIDELYTSFCFDTGAQADWEAMQSLFAEGANFASPIREGAPVRIQDAQAFIADFKAWVDGSAEGFHERIIKTQIEAFGNVATAAVTFEGFVPGNDEVQTLGLDNLQLVLDRGQWKLASFSTQYASESLPMPAGNLPDVQD